MTTLTSADGGVRGRRGKTRTFKPRRDVPEGTKQYQLRKYAEATLVSACPARDAGACPPVHGSLREGRAPAT